MSRYKEYPTQMKHRETLVRALVSMGFPLEHIEVHDDPKNLYGFHGDMRDEKAHVIIRRQHVGESSNDLGFLKTPEGFQVVISDFDRGQYFSPEWLGKLQVAYAKDAVTRRFGAEGFKVVSTTEKDGATRLVLQRFA